MPFPQVAANIRLARKSQGLTQERLARRLNISTRSVVAWETGRMLPSATNLRRLADELERDTIWFYEQPDEPVAA